MTKDKVIFRKYPEGNIIAFFPDDKYNDKFIWSYQHVGQHSGASPELIDELQLATPEEYKDLLDELISIGYDVEVCNE
jgi:hypothetical protein